MKKKKSDFFLNKVKGASDFKNFLCKNKHRFPDGFFYRSTSIIVFK